jgi:hypothetical protein
LLQAKLADMDTCLPGDLVPVKVPVKDSICSMRMNKPNTHLYGWTTGNQVFIWNLNDSVARTFKATDSVLTIEMSDNAKYLAVIYKNSTGEIFTADGNQKFSFKTTINHIMNDRLVRFFPTGKYFMAAVNGNQTQIYDSSGICLYNL